MGRTLGCTTTEVHWPQAGVDLFGGWSSDGGVVIMRAAVQQQLAQQRALCLGTEAHGNKPDMQLR